MKTTAGTKLPAQLALALLLTPDKEPFVPWVDLEMLGHTGAI